MGAGPRKLLPSEQWQADSQREHFAMEDSSSLKQTQPEKSHQKAHDEPPLDDSTVIRDFLPGVWEPQIIAPNKIPQRKISSLALLG